MVRIKNIYYTRMLRIYKKKKRSTMTEIGRVWKTTEKVWYTFQNLMLTILNEH